MAVERFTAAEASRWALPRSTGPGPRRLLYWPSKSLWCFPPACSALPVFAIVVPSLVGCAGAQKRIYTPDEVRAELETRVSAQMRDEIVIPFEIDDDIRPSRTASPGSLTDDRLKVRAIVQAIIGLAGFSISYDWLSNKTAREVFRRGQGQLPRLQQPVRGHGA